MGNPKAVGVNLLWLHPGVVGGSEEYTVKLLRAADDVNQGSEASNRLAIRLYVTAELLQHYPDLDSRFETRTAPSNSASVAGKGQRILIENSWLASRSRHEPVMHHAGGTIPVVRGATPLVTVHDLQPLEFPQNFSTVKRRWLQTMIPRSVHAARTVICPSRFSADRVIAMLGVSANKVKVVAHGHEPVPALAESSQPTLKVRERFGNYLLYPAIAYPHKRHADIVATLDTLKDKHQDLSVVFTGRVGPESANLENQAKALGLEDRVHVLGRVPSEELDVLYRSALVTVIPSSYEGFGNPALEAMARGCPLIVADATALPEVAGDAAIKVPVGDIGAWSSAVERLLSDEGATAAELRKAGLERAKSFDWETAGAALLELYAQAHEPYVRP